MAAGALIEHPMPTPETVLHWQCRECGSLWASELARDECEREDTLDDQP